VRDAGPPARFLAGDARRLPFPDNAFDIVSSESLLEHVRHPAEAIAEMHRVVKPEGLVYAIFGPLYYTAGGAHYEGDYDHLLLNHQEFVQQVKRRGRSIEHRECLHYLAADMFSYWTADQYLAEFRRHRLLHSAVFVSPGGQRFRRSHHEDWARLRERHSERDLLISGLALWSRKCTR
jgi:ubiquinone/menaquinone biosynthesis C-methylase UbiE